MIPLLLALHLQQAAPTVGDTIWVAQSFAVPRGATVRPGPWTPAGDVESLGPARVRLWGDSAEVAYPAVVWRPGTHEVVVPGPLLLLPGGGVDSVAGVRRTLAVASVLPEGRADSTVTVQAPVAPIPLGERSVRPLAALWLLALVLLLPLHRWWRRRGAAPATAVATAPPRPPALHWADAGEARVALAAATTELREAIARGVPEATTALDALACLERVRARRTDWPVDELSDLLQAIDEARFRPEALADVVGLVEWAERLARELDGVTA